MRKLNIGFITTASGRWPKELPSKRHDEYSNWLNENFKDVNLIKLDSITVDMKDTEETVSLFRKEAVDLIIYLIGAFTGDNIITRISEELNVPVILWAPFEPPFDGGRIMANSLVAATMNAAALHRLNFKYNFVYGSYTNERVKNEISNYLNIYSTIVKLKNTYIGMLGYRPTAFYSSTFDETLIRTKFGIRMEEYDLKTIIDIAETVDDSIVEADIEYIKAHGEIKDLPNEYLENHSRLYHAIDSFIKKEGINALTIKCWPELGTLKYTPCGVISRFADRNYIIGCESDVDATITMLIQKYLTGKIPFMSDLITIDESKNSALFWHCGQAATQLKDPDCNLTINNHPLAGQGVAFYSTLKSGKVTVARMSNIKGKYKLFITKGEANPTEMICTGTMINIKLDTSVLETLYKIAEQGIPHHYSIIWEDIYDNFKLLCRILDIEVIE